MKPQRRDEVGQYERIRYATTEFGSTVSYAATHTPESALREMTPCMLASLKSGRAGRWTTSVGLWRRELIATLPRPTGWLDLTPFGTATRDAAYPGPRASPAPC